MTSGAESPWLDLSAQRAIPALVDAYGGRIYGLGLRMCGTPEDAEELVQETFLNAFRKWDQFEGRAEPSTWLYTIASRACGRLHRRRVGEPERLESLSELLPRADAEIAALTVDGTWDDVVRRDAREAVDRGLGEVPTTFRLPLVLHEIADFSLAEIAAILGVREGTVKTRVHRGRLMLRRTLEQMLPKKAAPEPHHSQSVCLDLLHTKQEALDRGVPFPLPAGELCERCQALFATLDLAHDICRQLGDGPLPEAVKQVVLDRVGLPEGR